ncbi:uncharacterized protein LOC127813537 isoform X1 [Diospyros lotus]|uniref:uncharacterized protein LOC127813537 isoform X1 n=1 Tax=Diospyros lotus TaxID=55363 RepID=UPI00224EA98D|nr:uncharacterized protein LOC127813537 isoform X1 [Diospyros lotus]
MIHGQNSPLKYTKKKKNGKSKELAIQPIHQRSRHYKRGMKAQFPLSLSLSSCLCFSSEIRSYWMMLISKVWKWYRNCLATHPVKTQIVSSGLIWGFGDVAAQSVTHFTARKRNQISDEDEKLKINWRRVATTSLFGFGFVGPVGHFWYEGLDRYIKSRLQLQPKSFGFVASKVVIDDLIFGPFDLLVFFTYMGFSTGKSPSQVKEDVKRDFIPAFIMGGSVWPILQVGNFRYVPVRYQLLYVNFFCLLDSCFLSWLEQQQDASWKQWFKSFPSMNKNQGSRDGEL